MDAHIRLVRVHAGAFAAHLAELVADRILDLERGKIQTLQRAFDRSHVDTDGVRHIEPVAPRQREGGVVDVLLGAVAGARHAPQYAAGRTTVQIDAIAQYPIAGEMHAAVGGLDSARAQLGQFVAQRCFQTARAGGKKLFLHSGFTVTRITIAINISTGTSLKKRNHTWLCVLRPCSNFLSSLPQ